MSKTFNKNGVRGFTLIELLVVIAIIGLLSTIIAAPIQNARKKARDAKKIAELKAMQLALEQYAESNSGNYPATLSVLSPAYMPLLPTFAASTTSSQRDAFGYVSYDALAAGGATSTFAYHLGAKLEVYGPALETDRDCISGILSTQLLTPNCAVYNGSSLIATKLNNGTGIPNVAVAGTGISGFDFLGGIATTTNQDTNDEIATTTCVGISECIFDVTSQQ